MRTHRIELNLATGEPPSLSYVTSQGGKSLPRLPVALPRELPEKPFLFTYDDGQGGPGEREEEA